MLSLLQRGRKEGTLSKSSSGVPSGGEEEPEDDAHTPLPPPMEIIKDPSAQDEKVGVGDLTAMPALSRTLVPFDKPLSFSTGLVAVPPTYHLTHNLHNGPQKVMVAWAWFPAERNS